MAIHDCDTSLRWKQPVANFRQKVLALPTHVRRKSDRFHECVWQDHSEIRAQGSEVLRVLHVALERLRRHIALDSSPLFR